ncbi:MAG: ABC transporter permease [Pseudomonadales bacterium]|nr:ABC transporter permease [Pseudomonadales bacterium]
MAIISWLDLAWCLVPVVLICTVYVVWQGEPAEILVAVARMAIQLVAVGYVLISIFANPSVWLSLLIVSVMLLVAAWIAIRPVRDQRGYWWPAMLALGCSVSFHLFISLVFVLRAESWFNPQLLIPLAGMYLANTMNAISLAAERYHAELDNHQPEAAARLTAFHAAMIPQINSLLAVGLVALPGMMTGQILSGVSPLIAVRYQIMIMTMIVGAAGSGAALMLWLLGKHGRRSAAIN